jgi:hypothetical protein
VTAALSVCYQFIAPILRQRRAPLTLWLHCSDLSAATRSGLMAARTAMRHVQIVGDLVYKHLTAHRRACTRYRAAWGAAALTIAFVRAHAGHPFARSVVPLIPSVVTLAAEDTLDDARGLEKRASALLDMAFAKSHFASASSASASSAAAAPIAGAAAAGLDGLFAAAALPDGDADGDATMSAVAERSDRKRRR